MSIPLSKPFIRRKEMDAVLGVLVTDDLGPGALSDKLATEIGRLIGHDDSAAFSDPLVAVLALWQSLGLSAGDSIALSPLAPGYYQTAASYLGLRLIYLDTLENSPVIDPDQLQNHREDPPKMIIADEALGYIPDFAALKKYQIPILEDYSQAFAGFRDLAMAGSQGDYALCHLSQATLLQGGAAILSCKSKKNPISIRALSQKLPLSSRLSQLQAALPVTQFFEREKLVEKRKDLYRHLFLKLQKPYLLPVQEGDSDLVPIFFPVLVESGLKDVISYAKKKGVDAQLAFEEIQKSQWEQDEGFCPRARRFWMRCVLFPLYPSLTAHEAEHLGKVISTLP